jgi:hypothetical protein
VPVIISTLAVLSTALAVMIAVILIGVCIKFYVCHKKVEISTEANTAYEDPTVYEEVAGKNSKEPVYEEVEDVIKLKQNVVYGLVQEQTSDSPPPKSRHEDVNSE